MSNIAQLVLFQHLISALILGVCTCVTCVHVQVSSQERMSNIAQLVLFQHLISALILGVCICVTCVYVQVPLFVDPMPITSS